MVKYVVECEFNGEYYIVVGKLLRGEINSADFYYVKKSIDNSKWINKCLLLPTKRLAKQAAHKAFKKYSANKVNCRIAEFEFSCNSVKDCGKLYESKFIKYTKF